MINSVEIKNNELFLTFENNNFIKITKDGISKTTTI